MHGQVPSPGNCAIGLGEQIDAAVRRIAREQIDGAVAKLAVADPEDPRAVHSLRKSCKRIRALLRLVRGELEPSGVYRRENVALRDLARPFSDIRDADVALATYDRLMAGAGARVVRRRYAPIRAALTRRRQAVLDAPGMDMAARLQAARLGLLEVRARIDDWPLANSGFDAIWWGFRKTYRRAYRRRREAMVNFNLELMHEWRKRTKYHRIHLRLLRFLWPPVIEARQNEAERLGEMLGDERDLRLLRDLVASERHFRKISAADEFVQLLDKCADALREEATMLGQRFFAQPPAALLSSIRAWWDACEAEASGRRMSIEDLVDWNTADVPRRRPRRRKKPAGLADTASPATKEPGDRSFIALQDILRDDLDLVR